MKKILFLIMLFSYLFQTSCSYKPLYKKQNFDPYKINIIVKSKGRYGQNTLLLKNILERKFNSSDSIKSNLKLIISLNRNVSNLGVNKDLNTFGKRVTININYSMYDKKGVLTSGNFSNSSTFNFSLNDYGNLTSLEDSFSKLIKDASENIANLILAEDFNRALSP